MSLKSSELQFHALYFTAALLNSISFSYIMWPLIQCYLQQKKKRAEGVLVLPYSMPLILHLCLLPLLLLICSSTSCLGSQYEECGEDIVTCGGKKFGYPFGKNGSGCGDPQFQLHSCDSDGHPVLDISGDKYHILELSWNNEVYPGMTLLNDNLWGGKCNLSGNYSQFWWPGSPFHISADTYTNLSLWGQCNKSSEEMPQLRRLQLCGENWYYNIWRPDEGARFCKTHLQIPIKQDDLPIPPGFISNLTFPWLARFEITWQIDTKRSQSCRDCWESKGICGYNISDSKAFLCYCGDNTSHPDKCPSWHPDEDSPVHGEGGSPNQIAISTAGRKNKHGIIIGCSVGGVVLAAIALVLFLTYSAKRRKTSPSQGATRNFSKYERKDRDGYVPRLKIGNLSVFSYEELRQATNCFHEENELGDGGFGSVYLGKLWDERIVAVKRLYQDNSRRVGQFINEVAIFSTLNHPHVVRLYGCTSADSPELLLVYEFVSNGTLADHLHGDRRNLRGLPWETRLNIAIQTAEALAFLHNFDPPIFHRDVKSSNILLEDNFNVKVADFGLCRHVPVNVSYVTTTPQGTPGYVDPEYHQYYQLTEKSDVYSYGVVLVEIISAKLAVDTNRNTREINLANMAISKIQERALDELVDPQLEMEMNHKVKVEVGAVAELAFRCLASESDDRPHMKEVVAQLQVIRGLWGVSPSPLEQSASFPTHKHWRSFPTSVQDKRPSMSCPRNASA